MSQQRPNATRWIVVDDTSPEVSYVGPSGSWFDTGDVTSFFTRNDSGGLLNSNWLVYNATQHGTRLNSSFSFSYTGYEIWVGGTIENGYRDKGELWWHCYRDGNEVQNHMDLFNITTVPSDNNWFICGDWQTGGSDEGQHTLTVNISATRGLPFWFDWLRYAPLPDVSTENKVVQLDVGDPSILAGLSTGWDTGMSETKTKGASFNFEFIGTSFVWYGLARLDHVDPPTNNLSVGTYSVDNGPQRPVNFPIVPSRGHWFNEKFFDTGTLPMAKHNISVIYTYDGTLPLGLGYVRIQNGSLSELIAVSNPSPEVHSKRTTIVLSIVIPIIVIVVVLCAGCLIWNRQRKRRLLVEPFHSDIVQQGTVRLESQSEGTASVVPFPANAPLSGLSTPTSKSTLFGQAHHPSTSTSHGQGSVAESSRGEESTSRRKESGSVGLGRSVTYRSGVSEAPPEYTA